MTGVDPLPWRVSGYRSQAAARWCFLREQERRIEKVSETIARVGNSEPLGLLLRREEAKRTEARSKLAALTSNEAAPENRPDPALVRRQFEELTRMLDESPERAREAAHRLLTDIVVPPTVEDGEDVYAAVGGVKTSSAAHLGGRVLVSDGCGGRI